jgi:hypothetical protein
MIKAVLYNVGSHMSDPTTIETVVSLIVQDENLEDVKNLVGSIGKEYVLVEAPAIPE